ncbi:MAG: cation diffusion facilitator family transporter [Gemmataceae bacterium]
MTQPNLRGPIVLSVVAAVLTIGMKGTAYLITGSVGLFSDALESGVNLLAALTAYFSLWYSSRPADPNHTFGHEKIEFFSSGLEGVLIGVAGIGTAYYAVNRLIFPAELQALGLGGGLALAASAINFAVARVLLTVGRRHGSVVLEADGHHLMTDVWTSVGVVGGLGLVWLTGVRELDALLALAVGLHIVWVGVRLVRVSFDGLMDHALPPAEVDELRVAITAALPPGTAFHLLRTRRAGRRKFADFHVLVSGALTVREAHDIAHSVEERLRERLPELMVATHIEPIDDPNSWEADELARLGEAVEPLATTDAPAGPTAGGTGVR